MRFAFIVLAIALGVSAQQAEKQRQKQRNQKQQEIEQRYQLQVQEQQRQQHQAQQQLKESSSSSSSESQEQRSKHNRNVQSQQQKIRNMPHQTEVQRTVAKMLEKLHQESLRQVQPVSPQSELYLQALQAVSMMEAFNSSSLKPEEFLAVGSLPDIDKNFFIFRAIRKWIMRQFVDTFSRFAPPNQQELQESKRTYNALNLGDYTAKGKSGVVISLPISTLKQVVDVWVHDNVISKNDAEVLKLMMDGEEGQKYVKENNHQQNQQTIVFSVIGFISLRTSLYDQELTGSLIYAMKKFQYQTAMEIIYETTKDCAIWGLFCKTKVTAKPRQTPISGQDSQNVWNYIKHNTLQNFVTDNSHYIKYLDAEADKYGVFLPAKFRQDYSKMRENPTIPPDQLVPHDAFNPASYQL